MDSWTKGVLGICVGVLVIAIARLVPRLKSRPGASANQLSHEIPTLRVLRPLLAIGFYGGLLDWVVPGRRLSWSYLQGPAFLRAGGAAACLAAVSLLWWSFETLGRQYRGGVGLWDDHQLVTRGPYRVLRHPIYAAFFLLMLGLWGMSESWLLGSSGVLLTAAIPALRLRTEERQLSERFGAEYGRWARSTKRFIPWIL